MVSFQCDGCADVVKKPKLDQHRSRCGASFTCIDCSKTFPTPVDWKGHTSCISEAEKYQKSMYKPKNNGSGRENPYANGSRANFQDQRGSWTRPPPRSQATGVNGIPLGTPPRMSPVTAPPLQDEKTRTKDTTIEPISKEEPKMHKKRKSEVTNAMHVEGADGPISCEEPKGKEGKDKAEEKKENKNKKEKREKAVVLEPGSNGEGRLPMDVTGDERPKKSKKGKKEKKDKHEPGTQIESASNGIDPASLSSSSSPPDVTGAEKSKEKEKKAKKHKGTDGVETGGAAQNAPAQTPSANTNMLNGKKKKRKSEMACGELEVNGEVDAISPSTEKKSKKRKRVAEEQKDVTEKEAAIERKVKKKVAEP